ncbi:MAG: rhomboid family intramembrane serine protease [Phycisphaeraceae bacterium]|nr:rhomboid family intramembrane serine protease [Phycisphaeraceae bacterium]MBX3367600.1 rhomboid family intramembrane serine protease [Phycisphaeraceae bacterium]
MLIPLGSDVHLRRPPLLTHVMLGISIAAAAAQLVYGALSDGGAERVSRAFALQPGVSPWWTWITYAFMHGGFLHLTGNCLFLFVFGPPVEDRLGRIGYTALYLAGAIFAGLAEWGLRGPHPMVGASGAISAVAGAFLVMFPRSGVRIFVFFILIGVLTFPAWMFILFHITWDFLKLGTGAGRTAVGAHLGGYFFGFVVASICMASGLVKREGLDLFSLGKQASRRRAIKEASFRAAKHTRIEAARPPDPQSEAIALARADVLGKLSEGDHAGAITAYRSLLGTFGHLSHAVTLPRERQYEIANRLFEQGEHATASIAYQRFLDAYNADGEAPTVRLMLGLVSARYLNDPVAAKRLIADALPNLRDESQAALARQLLAELG